MSYIDTSSTSTSSASSALKMSLNGWNGAHLWWGSWWVWFRLSSCTPANRRRLLVSAEQHRTSLWLEPIGKLETKENSTWLNVKDNLKDEYKKKCKWRRRHRTVDLLHCSDFTSCRVQSSGEDSPCVSRCLRVAVCLSSFSSLRSLMHSNSLASSSCHKS